MIIDTSLVEMYEQFYFLKKEANFLLSELYDLFPYEMELYYYLTLKELKEKAEASRQHAR
jgi:hypothetical protein